MHYPGLPESITPEWNPCLPLAGTVLPQSNQYLTCLSYYSDIQREDPADCKTLADTCLGSLQSLQPKDGLCVPNKGKKTVSSGTKAQENLQVQSPLVNLTKHPHSNPKCCTYCLFAPWFWHQRLTKSTYSVFSKVQLLLQLIPILCHHYVLLSGGWWGTLWMLSCKSPGFHILS